MRYYKAELPNAESYIKRGGSILRTTKNGVYNYASFQGNVSGLSFTNKPINSFTGEYYDIVEITRKEHTQLKKQEKEGFLLLPLPLFLDLPTSKSRWDRFLNFFH